MQKIAIISSSLDPAGMNIRNNLINNFGFKETNNGVFDLNVNGKSISSYLIDTELVHSENLDRKIDADLFIFASKHRSKENTPSFAVHSIGNWGEARLGGAEKTLVPTSAVFIKNFLTQLSKNQKEGYEHTMEATHHGPFLNKPSVFVEIGSTEKEWGDQENGKFVADLIMNAIKNEKKDFRIAAGLGGPHYCGNFNKISLISDIAFSFICPKFQLERLDEITIQQIMDKTIEKVDFFVLDWKGLGTEKQRIIGLLDEMRLIYVRSDKL